MNTGFELSRRLAWLLVFRAGIATALLLFTLAADIADWPFRRISLVLYAVVIGSYVLVVVLGVLLRHGIQPVILAAVYLTTSVAAAAAAVHATAAIESPFKFLYLFVVLEGAIVNGAPVAFSIASATSVAFGGQLALQFYGLSNPSPTYPQSDISFTLSALVHMAAFFVVAFLSGKLFEIFTRAREEVSDIVARLTASESMRRLVLEALPMAVITYDAATKRILTANPAWSRAFGSYDGVPEPIHQFVMQESGSQDLEMPMGDEPRSLSAVKAPLVDESISDWFGKQLFVVSVVDRTELRALERALEQNQRLASLGALSASLAHEIRNPLASISGSVELLSNDHLDEKSKRLRDIVQRETTRLDKLLEHFLRYAKPLELEMRHTDLMRCARDVAELCCSEPDSSLPGGVVVVNGPAALKFRFDPVQIGQVLWNLVRNAMHASPKGAPILIVVRDQGEHISVSVWDEGPGVPQDIGEHVFEPFRTTKESGNGLGLAIAYRIVSKHGGKMAFRREGERTCFEFSLPAEPVNE